MTDRREPLLVGEELEREYRTGPEVVRVLRGASVTVGVGEVVALVGASGVGKSTLLHLLGTLDRPSAGRVLFDGEDVFARGEAGQAGLVAREQVLALEYHATGRGSVESAEQVQQRRLADAGGAHQRHHLAGADRDRGAPQHAHHFWPGAVLALQLLADEQRLTHTAAHRPAAGSRPGGRE